MLCSLRFWGVCFCFGRCEHAASERYKLRPKTGFYYGRNKVIFSGVPRKICVNGS